MPVRYREGENVFIANFVHNAEGKLVKNVSAASVDIGAIGQALLVGEC